jgi:hypothetical protein
MDRDLPSLDGRPNPYYSTAALSSFSEAGHGDDLTHVALVFVRPAGMPLNSHPNDVVWHAVVWVQTRQRRRDGSLSPWDILLWDPNHLASLRYIGAKKGARVSRSWLVAPLRKMLSRVWESGRADIGNVTAGGIGNETQLMGDDALPGEDGSVAQVAEPSYLDHSPDDLTSGPARRSKSRKRASGPAQPVVRLPHSRAGLRTFDHWANAEAGICLPSACKFIKHVAQSTGQYRGSTLQSVREDYHLCPILMEEWRV